MVSEFDKDRYKKIMQAHNLTQKKIAEILTERYGIDTSENTVKNWTRNSKNRLGKTYQPELETLKALADMCNCSIQDFFSDADKKREQIAVEEISSKPSKYSQSISNAFLSEYPKHTQQLIKKCLLLTDEQQKELLEHVEEMARKNMEF